MHIQYPDCSDPFVGGVLVSGVGALMERVRQVGGRCHSSQVQPAGAAGGPGQPTGNTHTQTQKHIQVTLWGLAFVPKRKTRPHSVTV